MKKLALILDLIIFSIIISGNLLVVGIGYTIFSDIVIDEEYNARVILSLVNMIGSSLEQFHPILIHLFIIFSITIIFIPMVLSVIKSIQLVLKYFKQTKNSKFVKTNKFSPKKLVEFIGRLEEKDNPLMYMLAGSLKCDPKTGMRVIEITEKPNGGDEEEIIDDLMRNGRKYNITLFLTTKNN